MIQSLMRLPVPIHHVVQPPLLAVKVSAYNRLHLARLTEIRQVNGCQGQLADHGEDKIERPVLNPVRHDPP